MRAQGNLVKFCLGVLKIIAFFCTIVYVSSGAFLLEDRMSLSQLLTAQLLATQIYHFGNNVHTEELPKHWLYAHGSHFPFPHLIYKTTWNNLAQLDKGDFFLSFGEMYGPAFLIKASMTSTSSGPNAILCLALQFSGSILPFPKAFKPVSRSPWVMVQASAAWLSSKKDVHHGERY